MLIGAKTQLSARAVLMALSTTGVALAQDDVETPAEESIESAEAEATEAEATEDAAPEPSPTQSKKPWARGVSAEEQAAALESFKQGNDYFGQRQYGEALKLYKEALTHWKHPAIHFNTAVCQVNLDQPIEAYEHIQAALKYNDAPLGEELYAQGLTYQKLLTDRLGSLKVVAKDKGAKVTLDGEDLFTAPGEQSQVILPGKHQIVAELRGHFPFTQTVQVDPGAPTEVEVQLIPLNEATEFKRPMPTWLPWTVMGSGLVVGGVGYLLRNNATGRIDRYDDYIESECQAGCTNADIPDDIQQSLDSGKTLDRISIGTMAAGGAAVLTGVTLLIVNSPRPVAPQDSGTFSRAQFIPAVGPGDARVNVKLTF